MALDTVLTSDFDQKVKGATLPVLVDFYADWCGPCKLAEPILDELSTEYAGKVAFVKVDVDQNRELTSQNSILSIPTTVLYKAGAEVGRQIGFAGKQGYIELLKKAG